jgi:class 3 adenylate cyclase
VSGETQYARAGQSYIAYQIVGDGPFDLLFFPEWLNHVELQWEEPRHERFLNTLTSFSRLILFNPRGMGASDPLPAGETPTAEMWVDDLRTVLDAAGSKRPAIFGAGAGGAICMLFAATDPDRVRSLVLCNTCASATRAPDYPIGLPDEVLEQIERTTTEHWGQADQLPFWAPAEASDERLRSWFGRYERSSASPGMALAVIKMMLDLDVRPALSAIQAPTLVLHRSGDHMMTVEFGRYIAEHVAGSIYKELSGEEHAYWAGDSQAILDEVEEFLTGTRGAGPPDRILVTVLFTDIVGSTATAAKVGDRRWKDLLREHEAIVRQELGRFRGREIATAGDGFLATFDGPARAIKCARAVRDAVRGTGIEIRAGLHTGEVELHGDNVAGIAVHLGARVAGAAGPGEIFVSRTVVDLVAGSGLEFEDRGTHELKGVPGSWRLFALIS